MVGEKHSSRWPSRTEISKSYETLSTRCFLTCVDCTLAEIRGQIVAGMGSYDAQRMAISGSDVVKVAIRAWPVVDVHGGELALKVVGSHLRLARGDRPGRVCL